MSTSKSIVTKEKFLEWEIVKIINKQVMYEELGSAAPESVITCSSLFQESTYRGTLLQAEAEHVWVDSWPEFFSWSNQKAIRSIFCQNQEAGQEWRVSFFRQALAICWRSCLVSLLQYFTSSTFFASTNGFSLVDSVRSPYWVTRAWVVQMFLMLTVGNNTVPQ